MQVVGDMGIDTRSIDRGGVNFQNKYTIEFRNFNSTDKPHENLEKLASELAKVLGAEVVYDREEDRSGAKIQEETIKHTHDNGNELINALQSLGYNEQECAYAKKLNYPENVEPAEMISQAIKDIAAHQADLQAAEVIEEYIEEQGRGRN
jgi:hypothetical protein